MTDTQPTFLSEKMKTMYIEFTELENQKNLLFLKVLEYLEKEDLYFIFIENIIDIYKENIDKEIYRQYLLKIMTYYIFLICYDINTIKTENKRMFDLYIKKVKYDLKKIKIHNYKNYRDNIYDYYYVLDFMYLFSNQIDSSKNKETIYNDFILIYNSLFKMFGNDYIYYCVKNSYFKKKEAALEKVEEDNKTGIKTISLERDDVKYNENIKSGQENEEDEINIYCEECMDKLDNDDEAIILGAYTYCRNCKPKMSQIQKNNIETLDNSNENIVNNDIINNISDKKVENNKKNGPIKNKSEINIDNIYKEIKKYINYEYKTNEDIEDTILKKINEFHVNRTNKYNLMIELYNELINKGIDEPSKLSKYIKTNKNLGFINIFNDTKYRRLYNKCERLYKIKDYIDIKNLCISKMVDKIFNLKKDQFDNLILKLK